MGLSPRASLPLKLRSKHEACYGTPLEEDDRCGKCSHFVRPNRCQVVRGDVRAHGSCDLFERRDPRLDPAFKAAPR